MSENMILGIIAMSLGFVIVVGTFTVFVLMWVKDNKTDSSRSRSFDYCFSNTTSYCLCWFEDGRLRSRQYLNFSSAVKYFSKLNKQTNVTCLRLIVEDEKF